MVGLSTRVVIGAVVATCCVCRARVDPLFTNPSGESAPAGQQDDLAHNYPEGSSNVGRGLFEGAEIGNANANGLDEGKSIRVIDKRIQMKDRDWGRPGNGISMDLTGEPKSGTTWTQRIITELAVRLCGSETNTWCEMGGLKVIPRLPDPSYIWEMLHVDTGKVFLHFDGRIKHIIPGFKITKMCLPKGRRHALGFAKSPPCLEQSGTLSRQELIDCLPSTDSRCASYMPSRHPDVRRMPVVFRDPRDVVISSFGYRTKTVVVEEHDVESNLLDFIDHYFEIIVSWQHQRWIWHTTFYKEASHVMFYEDIKGSHLPLMDLAAFMGLKCTPEQAKEAWDSHTMPSPHKDYNSFDIPTEKIQYMNATMSKILPPEMAIRYGLTPI